MAQDPAFIVDDDSTLTPEEIAAIGMGDALDAEGNVVAADPAPAETTEDASEDAEGDAEAPEAEEAPAADDPALTAPETTEAAPPPAAAPRVEIPDVSEAQARLARVEEAKEALFDRYDEGQISRDDYKAEIKRIEAEAATDMQAVAWATRAQEDESARWTTSVRSYFDRYPGLADEGQVELFDNAVRLISRSDQAATMTNEQILAAAHKVYVGNAQALGLTPVALAAPAGAAASQPPAKETAAPAKLKAPKPQDVAPRTLRDIPAAESPMVNDGTYGHLEELAQGDDPDAYERALARLSPEQQEEFASMMIG